MKETDILSRIPFWRKERFNSKMLLERVSYPFNKEWVIWSFESLAKKLKPYIAGYDTIIGDDISGRLPTLVIGDLARKKREQLGMSPPKVFFINAGSNVSFKDAALKTIPKLHKLIKKHGSFENRKFLLVSEYMYTGRSVRALSAQLNWYGINPDVCAVEIKSPPKEYNFLTGKLFYGVIDKNVGKSFYCHTDLTGLKSTEGNPVAKKLRVNYDLKDGMRWSRESMKLIASEMWKIIK